MVELSDIVVGNCFVTSTEQLRRITKITDDERVVYESCSAKTAKREWNSFNTPAEEKCPKKEAFLEKVKEKVDCNSYNPD